jgi:hypothetical protein
MEQRKKRLISYTLQNLGTMLGWAFLMSMGTLLLIVGVRIVVGIWGQTVGFFTFGGTFALVGLTGFAYLKAKDDLRLAELEEERIMNRMRAEEVSFPGIRKK